MFSPEQLDRIWHSLSADREFSSRFACDVGTVIETYTDDSCLRLREYLKQKLPSVRDPFCQGVFYGIIRTIDGVRLERKRCST